MFENKKKGEYFSRTASAGEKVAIIMTMDGQIQNIGIVEKGLLSTIAMVNILDAYNIIFKNYII